MITWTVTVEQATAPTASGVGQSRAGAADAAVAAALDYFAVAAAPTPGLGAVTVAATITVGDAEVIAGPGYDRCDVYAAEATAAGLQTVRDHLATEPPTSAVGSTLAE